MPSLIGCFCHKELFFRPFPDRKRITKASYCKDDSYEQAKGEGGQLQKARITLFNPEFPILHDWAGLRTYLVWFVAVVSLWPKFPVPGSQFSVESRFGFD